jgi:hypothetical protein
MTDTQYAISIFLLSATAAVAIWIIIIATQIKIESSKQKRVVKKAINSYPKATYPPGNKKYFSMSQKRKK